MELKAIIVNSRKTMDYLFLLSTLITEQNKKTAQDSIWKTHTEGHKKNSPTLDNNYYIYFISALSMPTVN